MILLMKKVDTRLMLDRIISSINESEGALIPVAGHSMEPFLKDGRDQIYLLAPKQNVVYKPGDIVLFQRENGQYVLHRIAMASEKLLMIWGDNQLNAEPVKPVQVKAVVSKAKCSGHWITPENLVWKFFAGPWNRAVWLRRTAAWMHRIFHRQKRTD